MAARYRLDATLLTRLKTAEQFADVLNASKSKNSSSGVWRSAHFVLHMVAYDALPQVAAQSAQNASSPTIGVICPKRWAKRAVTRNTIKRQIYAVTSELVAQLPPAYLVVRLSALFSREQFVSATSPAFKRALRAELIGLLGKLQRPVPPLQPKLAI